MDAERGWRLSAVIYAEEQHRAEARANKEKRLRESQEARIMRKFRAWAFGLDCRCGRNAADCRCGYMQDEWEKYAAPRLAEWLTA
ncbi:MAG: hypothetical protein WCD38_11710 [Candidatus Tumulicola sp.]